MRSLSVFVLACLALYAFSLQAQLPERNDSIPRPPFAFDESDEAFLEEVQRGAFNFLWNEIDPETGMVLDRTGVDFISVAGVGYQLGAICVADTRGWITHDEAEKRTLRIVRALADNPDNRPGGVFYHFLEPGTAGPSGGAYEQVASTVDTAILFAGLLTASAHFGGEVAETADRLVAEAEWNRFIDPEHERPYERAFISLGWEKPEDPGAPFEDGLLPYTWADAADEQRLTAFIAMCSPHEDNRVSPETYYRMRRTLGDVPGEGQVAWFPWSGALFTSFFAHLWIDYAAMGADDPKAFGIDHRPAIDWWENSRRHVSLHRQKAMDPGRPYPWFGEYVWGLSACDGETGYLVPGHFPELSDEQPGRPDFDHLTVRQKDDWRDGTVAPYTAASAIMFQPDIAIQTLRHYRSIAEDAPGLWADPAQGGYGFADSFRLNAEGEVDWVAHDRVAIDAGPMLIAIENARTGIVWNIFGSHAFVQGAQDRLGLRPER